MGLVISLLIASAEKLFPGHRFTRQVAEALSDIDFTDVVMNGMLAFLLFAAALGLAAITVPVVLAARLVALALSLPADPTKPMILAATYAVVLVSVLVQGSTIGRVARLTPGHDDRVEKGS